MGIDGLLNLLRPITKKEHLSTFRGQKLAIDALPWIYKGCYSCAFQLNQNVESIDFLYYILEMIEILSYYNITPLFVFDGRNVFKKNETLEKRRQKKQQNKEKGLQLLKAGKVDEAKKYLSRCIMIDERIIAMTMSALKTKNIEFMVAPYEADCQIAKLKRLGVIDGAISEDSDLVVYGVNVILKLNQHGQCDYLDLTQHKSEDHDNCFLKIFLNFDNSTRIDACILAGSDYNASVKGIGIKRAIKLLHKQVTMNNVINKLKVEKVYANRVPEKYEETVLFSKLIFSLSTVYNPILKKLEFLDQSLIKLMPEGMTQGELLNIVGPDYGFDEQVLNGTINAKNLQPRELNILNLSQVFSINKQNLLTHEFLNHKRRVEEAQIQKRKQEEKANQPASKKDQIYEEDDGNANQSAENKAKKTRKPKIELSEAEKQKIKQERKSRLGKLKLMMDSLIDTINDDQEEQDDNCSQISQENIQEKNNIEKNEHQTAEKQESELEEVGEESIEQDLGFLNPFAKKPIVIQK